jgi:hypothetical protein
MSVGGSSGGRWPGMVLMGEEQCRNGYLIACIHLRGLKLAKLGSLPQYIKKHTV